jgi:hypothetical protein
VEILPTLTAPIKGEVLFMYIAAPFERISAVLLVERDKIQIPIYFVSRALQGAKLSYPELEKQILALVHATRRFRRYFQDHPIMVLADRQIDEAKSVPLLRGHLSPNSRLFDQLLP